MYQKAGLSACPELAEEGWVSKKSQQLRNQTNTRGSVSLPVVTQHQMPGWRQDAGGQAAAGPLKNVASSPVWQGMFKEVPQGRRKMMQVRKSESENLNLNKEKNTGKGINKANNKMLLFLN